MNRIDVKNAALAATREFGAPYGGPCELAGEISEHPGARLFTVNLNDTRKSQATGPVFWFDVSVDEHQTPEAVRDYARLRIRQYLGPERT